MEERMLNKFVKLTLIGQLVFEMWLVWKTSFREKRLK